MMIRYNCTHGNNESFIKNIFLNNGPAFFGFFKLKTFFSDEFQNNQVSMYKRDKYFFSESGACFSFAQILRNKNG